MEIFVGIPCYRVATSIRGVLDRVHAAWPDAHLILVNDGSPDDLDTVIASIDTERFRSFTYHKHDKNRGYGGAQKTILRLFKERARDRADALVVLHGDGQTAESEIRQFVEFAEQRPYLDVVFGSRMQNSLWDQWRRGRPAYKVLADYFLTLLQNHAYGLRVTTYTSGYKLLRKKGLDKFAFEQMGNHHAFDTEFLILSRIYGLRYGEIRIAVVPNDTGVSANRLGLYALNTLRLLRQYAYRWRSRAPRYLIVNSDDYGYARSVNDGIADAFRTGAISSATIMPNMEYFQEAVAQAQALGFANRLGAHINLTEGMPLGSGYRTLTDQSGAFHGIAALLLRAWTRRLDPSELEREIRLQIERCTAAGIRLTHIDTHQWSQTAPDIARALAKAALSHGVCCARRTSESVALLNLPGSRLRALANAAVVRVGSLFSDRRLAQAGLLLPDHYTGVILTGHRDLERAIIRTIKHLKPGVTELVCHVGSGDGSDMDNSYYQAGRAAELAALSSRQVRQELEARSVRLLSFKEFWEL